MNTNPVGWFEIYVEDIARAKKFYEAVLSCSLEKLNSPKIEMWAFPMNPGTYGAPGALVKMPGFSSGSNSILVYFSCQDCSIEEARIEENGGYIQKPKQSIGEYGFITLAFDTEGNMFGLHSQK